MSRLVWMSVQCYLVCSRGRYKPYDEQCDLMKYGGVDRQNDSKLSWTEQRPMSQLLDGIKPYGWHWTESENQPGTEQKSGLGHECESNSHHQNGVDRVDTEWGEHSETTWRTCAMTCDQLYRMDSRLDYARLCSTEHHQAMKCEHKQLQ